LKLTACGENDVYCRFLRINSPDCTNVDRYIADLMAIARAKGGM
jgi:hypothetical protein